VLAGQVYTFRLTATDNTSNTASAEDSAFTSAVTKYYYLGSQRVAVRKPDGAVNWLHGDHLGSTSLATDADGQQVSRQLYYPFGEVRWASADMPTDFGYTGQRLDGTGLMFYHARYYAPYLNRWIQPDNIVPQLENPQSLNRFSYVLNNPLKFTDPSGHCEDDPDAAAGDPCWDAYYEATGILGSGFEFLAQWEEFELRSLLKWLGRGFNFTGTWTSQGMTDVRTALEWIENAMPDGWDTMAAAFGIEGGGSFTYDVCPTCYADGCHWAIPGRYQIVFDQGDPGITSILHETGHVVDYYLEAHLDLSTDSAWWSETGLLWVGWIRIPLWNSHYYVYSDANQDRAYSEANPMEDFADTFTAWVLDSNGQPLPGVGWRIPSLRRQNVLTTALDELVP
jgi:RHS repeat-associated protein